MSKNTLEQYSIDDLDHFWTTDGLPMFVADRPDICDIIESIGFNIYYLFANEEKVVTPTYTNNTKDNKDNKNKTNVPQTYAPVVTLTTKIYKVVNNFIGRAVSLAENVAVAENVISVEETALYTMPLIPHVLIDKLDQFFRLVDAQHGTESIVILTYDTTKTGPEGWGILVPDQTNTSVHCNYDPHSIAEAKPDDVMIVGSVHSHPGMSAYASGTDHKDQADFDGIHITFGWQKSVNNGATQYHIEMQMSGNAYTLKPEQVFEDYLLDKSPDAEVIGWTDKVKKVSPPNMGGTHTVRTPSAPPANLRQQELLNGQAVQGYIPRGTQDSGVSPRTSLENIRTLPHFDIEDDAIIIAEVDFSNGITVFCPACGAVIDHIDNSNSCCEFCDIPLAQKNDSLASILDAVAYYCYQNRMSYAVPAYLWCTDETGCHFVIRLTPTNIADALMDAEQSHYSSSPLTLVEENDDDSIFLDPYFDHNGTRVTADHVMEFENLTKDIYVYDHTSACSDCENYYTPQCPAYADMIADFASGSVSDVKNLEQAIDDIGCRSYIPFTTTIGSFYD